MNLQVLNTIRTVAKQLPIPLVGSVMYNGNKETRNVTDACFQAFEEAMILAGHPKRILEIGTHAGGSACMMLGLSPESSIVSVDIGHTWIKPDRSFADWHRESHEGGLLYVEKVLKESFGNERFTLYIGDSTAPETFTYLDGLNKEIPFTFAFVDGNHALEYVEKDIKMCLSLGIKNMILDDYNLDDGGEVSQAATRCGLKLVKEWKELHSGRVSMALCQVS